jgi:hypothetical protein
MSARTRIALAAAVAALSLAVAAAPASATTISNNQPVVTPGAAVAAQGGTDLPLEGTGSGTLSFNFIFGTPISATAEGTAHFSHLGMSTYTQDYTITATSPTTYTLAGTETIVAANGDMLVATLTGAGDNPLFIVGETFETTVLFTIDGGTGRFLGASGTQTATFTSVIDSIAGTTITSSQTSTRQGTITY